LAEIQIKLNNIGSQMSTQGCWEKRLRAWEIHKPSGLTYL